MDIELTQSIIKGIASGDLLQVRTKTDAIFGYEMPLECPGVDPTLLAPENTWKDKDEYFRAKVQLAQAYQEVFKAKFASDDDSDMKTVLAAGPRLGKEHLVSRLTTNQFAGYSML